MITVEDKEEIRRLFYIEHRSIRWIARTLGHSRKTVRKALGDASAPVEFASRIALIRELTEAYNWGCRQT